MNGLEAFAAQRDTLLTSQADLLKPIIADTLGDESWPVDVLDASEDIYRDVFDAEGGPGRSRWTTFVVQLRASLNKATEPHDENQVDRIATWLATALVNKATLDSGGRGASKTWVTMRDEDVRDTHVPLHGQTANFGERFTVGAARLAYPGEPRGPVEGWINCRCVLSVQPQEETMTAALAMDEPMDDEARITDEYIPQNPLRCSGVLAPEGIASGDGRKFSEGALSWRELPIPLLWQPSNLPGHDGAVSVGNITDIYRDGNLLRWAGTFASTEEADKVIGLIGERALRGISVDVDSAEMATDPTEENPEVEFGKGRISAATICAIPAFAEAYIQIGVPEMDQDGDEEDAESQVASAFRDYDAEERRRMAEDGRALPDGSFPIADTEDLMNAIRAIGRAKDPEAAKAHIKKRAKALEAENMLPETWGSDSEVFASNIDTKPTEGMAEACERALGWIAEGLAGDGFEEATAERARKIAAREPLTEDHIRRMYSYFSRHAGDGKAEGFDAGEDGFPSPGRVAWDAWGGDAGASWSETKWQQIQKAQEAAADTESFKRGPGWVTDPVPTARIHEYWIRGEGAAKIRWGTPGDFTRCTRQLAKYVGPMFLNRTCAQWHHDALGYWPGELGKPGNPPDTPENRRRAARNAASADTDCVDCQDTALVASVTLTPAPQREVFDAAWFRDPQFTGPQAVTISDDGYISGHLAVFGTCHIGIQDVCVTPPMSKAAYAYFTTGAVLTTDGEIPVGSITMDTGHASLSSNARAAASHYDDTGAVVADVAAGEDAYGIWIAGALRPGLEADKRERLRASALSGDWRAIRGNLELVAALAVNVPGFPIPRTGLAASAGVQTALVAAGVVQPAEVSRATNVLNEWTRLRAESLMREGV